MMRVAIRAGLLSLFLLLVGLPARGAPLADGIRIGTQDDRTRVVLDVAEHVDFTVSREDEPPRLIIDLPEVEWRIRPHPLAQPRGLVTGYVYGRHVPGRSRLVVDLASPAEIKDQFILPPSDGLRRFRIVVDIVAAEDLPAPPPDPLVVAAQEERFAQAQIKSAATSTAGIIDLVPIPRPVLTPAATPNDRPMIVIDPGHGGADPGTIGINGALEKDIVLAMASELRKALLATGRYRVALTRDDDSYLALRDRVRVAREAGADLFLSLHADSLGDSSFRGASVYTISETASDGEAARLAAKENKADIIAGADLTHQDPVVAGILVDLAFRNTNNRSIAFAERLVDELDDVTHLIRRHRRHAGFAVLKAPDVPSVLVELGYLSNPRDATLLADADHRRRLAGALLRAIDRQFGDAD